MTRTMLLKVVLILAGFSCTLSETKKRDACSCAVFSKEDVKPDDAPLIEQSFLGLPCNVTEEQDCMKFCITMAEMRMEDGLDFLCHEIKRDVTDLQGFLFFSCENGYKYAGSSRRICCLDEKSVTCEEKNESTTTGSE